MIEDVRDMTTPLSEFAEHFTNEGHVDYEGPFLMTSVRDANRKDKDEEVTWRTQTTS